MTYRLSNEIVDNKARGGKRQIQEVFAFLVNPLNGLNRIIDGRWGKVHFAPDDSAHTAFSGVLDIGGRRISESSEKYIQ
jgi:hypothetical protein